MHFFTMQLAKNEGSIFAKTISVISTVTGRKNFKKRLTLGREKYII